MGDTELRNIKQDEFLTNLLGSLFTSNPSRIDDTGVYIYRGYAEAGTAESAASWRISRLDMFGTTLCADGDNNFDNIWDNRASLTYS